MILNKLRQLWAEGKPTINGWCSIGNAFTAEIMAAQGYDSITVDLQHGALDYSSPWAVLNFLVNPDDNLNDERPIDVLRRGELNRVLESARRIDVQGA